MESNNTDKVIKGPKNRVFGSPDELLRHALNWHLVCNHFPYDPSRVALIEPCARIIERYRAGDHDLSYRVHGPESITAEKMVEQCHLDAFLVENA